MFSSGSRGGGQGARTPLLGHDVGFLTLGPKMHPLLFLLVDLRCPPPFLKNPGSAPDVPCAGAPLSGLEGKQGAGWNRHIEHTYVQTVALELLVSREDLLQTGVRRSRVIFSSWVRPSRKFVDVSNSVVPAWALPVVYILRNTVSLC